MADPALALDNPFWRFSLATYARPAVAEACISLQDTYAADVNVLLFCAWIGADRRRTLTAAELHAVEATARPWREAVIGPLRTVRRGIKGRPEMADAAVQALRRDVAATELAAERIVQALLFAGATASGRDGEPPADAAPANEPVTANVFAYLDLIGCRDRAAVAPLLAAVRAPAG